MSVRTIASMSVLLVSAGLLSDLPAQALDTGLCNRVYKQVASASSNQSSKSQNINGGGSYGPFSVSGGSQYSRSNAASQSDLNRYYESNCDSYIQAVYGVKLAEIQARERMNANNNQANLQITRNTNGANVQMNREDNQTRRNESKDNLIGTGISSVAQVLAASINRPRNPEPPPAQQVSSNPAPTQPMPTVEPPIQPTLPNPYTQTPAQIAYAPPTSAVPSAQASAQVAYAPPAPTLPFLMFSSNPGIPVSPVIIAKVNAALASQGLTSAACNINPIVVLNIANGQYTACAYPSAAYPAGNYRLTIPGF